MVGLGRMGGNIVRRLLRAGHQAVVWDRNPAPGATIKIAASKAVRFRVSKPLKDAVNK